MCRFMGLVDASCSMERDKTVAVHSVTSWFTPLYVAVITLYFGACTQRDVTQMFAEAFEVFVGKTVSDPYCGRSAESKQMCVAADANAVHLAHLNQEC